jgi:hypothetical protein
MKEQSSLRVGAKIFINTKNYGLVDFQHTVQTIVDKTSTYYTFKGQGTTWNVLFHDALPVTPLMEALL